MPIKTFWLSGLLVISKALFSGSLESILSRYFLPIVAIAGLVMIPTADVHIEDVIKNRSYKVSHVPLFLAKFSELLSSIG